MDLRFLTEKHISLPPDPAACAIAQVRLDLLQAEIARVGEEPFITQVLTPEEQQILGRFSLAKRRLEWLGGRLAAKAVLHRLRRHDSGPPPDWQAAAILPAADGRPLAPGDNNPAGLSISHSGLLAIAMGRHSGPCGIDVQQLTPTITGIRHRYSNADERRMLDEHPLTACLPRQARLTILWTIKEACRKIPAAKIPGFLDITVRGPLTDDRGLLRCGGSFTAGPSQPIPFSAACWQEHDAMVGCVVPGTPAIPSPIPPHPQGALS